MTPGALHFSNKNESGSLDRAKAVKYLNRAKGKGSIPMKAKANIILIFIVAIIAISVIIASVLVK